MSKKSWFLEKIYAKNFHFNSFCPYFCPAKNGEKRIIMALFIGSKQV